MEELRCFICTNKTVLYMRNINKIKSKHSELSLHDCLKIICGDDELMPPSEKSEEDAECKESVICLECIEKINDYDAACIIKERIEREFRVSLQRSREVQRNVKSTNMIEVKVENIEDIVDTSFGCEYSSDTDGTETKTDEWQNRIDGDENKSRYLQSGVA